jgi:phage protein D
MTKAPVTVIWVHPDRPVGPGGVIKEPVLLPFEVSSLLTRFRWKMNPKPMMDTFEMTFANARMDLLDAAWLQQGQVLEIQWGYAPDNLTPRKLGKITGVMPRGGKEGVTVDITGNTLGHVMAGKQRHCRWTRVNRGELPSSAGAHYSPIAQAAWRATIWGGRLAIGAEEEGNPQLGYAASEIAIALADAYGLKADVQSAGPIKAWWQCGESDWDFLMRLASEAVWIRDSSDIGFRFWVDGKTLHFHAVTAKEDEAVLMRLAWYCDDTGILKSFEVKHDSKLGQGAASEATVLGWDPRKATPRGSVATSATFGNMVSFGTKTDLGPGVAGTGKNRTLVDYMPVPMEAVADTHDATDKGSADPVVRSTLTGDAAITAGTTVDNEAVENPAEKDAATEHVEAGSAQVEMEIRTVGWPTLWPPGLLDVQCLGSKYSGVYEIEGGEHCPIGSPEGYECTLTIKRNAKGTDEGGMDGDVNRDAKVVESPGEEIKYVPFDFGDIPVPEAVAAEGGGAR